MPPKHQHKPKLTAEEKKQLRIAKKAEKKAKLVEKRKQLQRDQLERELQYGRTTLRKHEKDWRKMLIDMTVPEMRKDLEFAWHNFERVIDAKDFVISLKLDELESANQQYLLNMKTHTEQVDMLINMFDDRMRELYRDYQQKARDIQDEYATRCQTLAAGKKEDENYLKTMLFILQKEMKEIARTRQGEYYSKLEEEECKQNQILQTMRGILERCHLSVWTDTVNFLNAYKNKISERKKMHTEMKSDDDKMQRVIQDQLEHVRKANATIRSLRVKKDQVEKFLGRKLGDLQSEFDFFTYAFNTLKNNLARDIEMDFTKVNLLTKNYNEVISNLDSLETKGKHILHVAAVCRKLETLEEKILPFPLNFITEMAEAGFKNAEHGNVLELFWQRVGQADASRYAVNEEKEFLLTEHSILKQRIHKYCLCLKCPNYEPFRLKAKPCSTVTEGTLEAQKYKKHAAVKHGFGLDEDEDEVSKQSADNDFVFDWK